MGRAARRVVKDAQKMGRRRSRATVGSRERESELNSRFNSPQCEAATIDAVMKMHSPKRSTRRTGNLRSSFTHALKTATAHWNDAKESVPAHASWSTHVAVRGWTPPEVVAFAFAAAAVAEAGEKPDAAAMEPSAPTATSAAPVGSAAAAAAVGSAMADMAVRRRRARVRAESRYLTRGIAFGEMRMGHGWESPFEHVDHFKRSLRIPRWL